MNCTSQNSNCKFQKSIRLTRYIYSRAPITRVAVHEPSARQQVLYVLKYCMHTARFGAPIGRFRKRTICSCAINVLCETRTVRDDLLHATTRTGAVVSYNRLGLKEKYNSTECTLQNRECTAEPIECTYRFVNIMHQYGSCILRYVEISFTAVHAQCILMTALLETCTFGKKEHMFYKRL